MRKTIVQLQQLMKENKIDLYYVPTGDDHQSEYAAEKYNVRKFLSGFTGSAGTLIVSADSAALWTDGRYFVQAEKQLKGSGIKLMKMGQPKVPTVLEYIGANLKEKQTIGFDGKVVPVSFKEDIEKQCKNIKFKYDKDLVESIWTDRPGLNQDKLWLLADKYSGKNSVTKLSEIREKMKENQVDSLVLIALEDVAWTSNLRGNDVECTPVFYSYMLIDKKHAYLYTDLNKISSKLQATLLNQGIEVFTEEKIYEDVSKLENQTVWMDLAQCSVYLQDKLPESALVYNHTSPVALMRACKNPVEVKNIAKAHVIDGVAVTRFMYWLKHNIKKLDIDEYQTQCKLEEFRKLGDTYFEPSFTTICAYGPNAAMMHYSAPEKGSAKLEAKDFLLVDSGGQYLYGTTDITRTFVLGPTDNEHKKWFTYALKSYLNLMSTCWLYGCTGLSLDLAARNPLWRLNMDYQCGTGHGVGMVLGVHEGPQAFKYKLSPGRHEDTVLEDGMTLTDEPGVYIPNKLGIRHENQVHVVKGVNNEYGQFMHLENYTMVPIDKDGIDVKYLTFEEVDTLNKYHAQVYKKISKYLPSKEAAWLKKACAPIVKK